MYVSRLTMQRLLGLVWIFDGVLQLKPEMFTKQFLEQVILPTSQGQPYWIGGIVKFGISVVEPHILVWNILFAVIQLGIGMAMLFDWRARIAIIVSLLWALIVWIAGEGIGQLFTGQSSLISGAPGSVLLYAFVGIAVWPPQKECVMNWRHQNVHFARYTLSGLWMLGSFLHLQKPFLQGGEWSQTISVGWVAHGLTGHAMLVSITLSVFEFLIGLAFLFRFQYLPVCWVSIVLSFVFWWVGQSFGEIIDPLSTDLNSGPLMILLTLCVASLCPKRNGESFLRGFRLHAH